jgi:hypothetical protein
LSGVLQALVAGLVTASSLLVGGLVAVLSTPREHTLALVMAFGAGVLLSAVACDLVLEALDTSGGPGIPLGNAAGALTFYAGDRIIDRAGGGRRKAVRQPAEQGSPRAIVLGTVLDGVPESIVVGLTLLVGGGVSLALLVAALPVQCAGGRRRHQRGGRVRRAQRPDHGHLGADHRRQRHRGAGRLRATGKRPSGRSPSCRRSRRLRC